MHSKPSKSIGEIFGDKWPLYQRAIRSNILCHEEMFGMLDRLLTDRFDQPFHFADFGCGDASAALTALYGKRIAHYTGVDASSELIATASETLASTGWQTTLICQDMATAITELPGAFDVVLCSYSLHHLLLDEKIKFIQNCYDRLKSPGYFVLIDGVAREDESRERWLNRLDKRFLEKVPEFTAEERAEIMEHPWKYDYPESIQTFRRIAGHSGWRSFEVFLHLDDFLAFLLFVK